MINAHLPDHHTISFASLALLKHHSLIASLLFELLLNLQLFDSQLFDQKLLLSCVSGLGDL
jgi:hypothetical protein